MDCAARTTFAVVLLSLAMCGDVHAGASGAAAPLVLGETSGQEVATHATSATVAHGLAGRRCQSGPKRLRTEE